VVVVIIQPSLSERNEGIVARGVFGEVLVERDLAVANLVFARIEDQVLDLANLRPISASNVPAPRVRLVLRHFEVVQVLGMDERAAGVGIGTNGNAVAIFFGHLILLQASASTCCP